MLDISRYEDNGIDLYYNLHIYLEIMREDNCKSRD